LWLAESGVQRALQRLASSADYHGETWAVPSEVLGGTQSAVVRIQVTKLAGPQAGQQIAVEARYPADPVYGTLWQRAVFVKATEP
jgi:hypothetical protein